MNATCPNCGNPVGPSQRFCRNCGAALLQPTIQSRPGMPSSPAARRSSKKGIFAGGALLMVAAAVAIAFFLFIGESDGGTVVEAKGLLSPEEFVASSGDLSSAIVSMNQKEQAAAKDLTDMAANPGPP